MQSFAARGGQLVELGSPIFGGPPTCLQQALADNAKQRRIQGSLLDEQRAVRDLPDAQQNTVAVKRTERDRFEDKKIEGSEKRWLGGVSSCSKSLPWPR